MEAAPQSHGALGHLADLLHVDAQSLDLLSLVMCDQASQVDGQVTWQALQVLFDQVLVIDKPLIGRFRPLAAEKIGAESGSLDDLLLHSPAIQGEFFDEVDRFRKTFVQVPGCENRTAERRDRH
eukprot:g22544.t1